MENQYCDLYDGRVLSQTKSDIQAHEYQSMFAFYVFTQAPYVCVGVCEHASEILCGIVIF